MTKIHDLLQQRHKIVEARIKIERPGLQRLRKVTEIPLIAAATKSLFCKAVNVPESADIGSSVANVPLPTLLSCGRRLTVDVVPSFLDDFEATYGITERAFLELAAKKAIFVNVRDYDPKAVDLEKEGVKYSAHAEFLSRLMAEAGDSVYFGAALRDEFLDNLPQTPVEGVRTGTRATLRKAFEGTENLKEAFDSVSGEASAKLRFREEKVSIAAARWHWAFVQSVKFFVSPLHLIALDKLYECAVSTSSPNSSRVDAIVRLVNTLRFMHLYYTAPLTASFGDTYNVMDNHESYNLYQIAQPIPSDADVDLDLHSFVDDLYDGSLDDRWKFNKDGGFQYFGVDSHYINDGRSHRDFYDTADNVDELAAYVVRDDEFKVARNEFRQHLEAMLNEASEYIRRHIDELAVEAALVRGKLAKTLRAVSQDHMAVATPNQQTRDAFILVDPKVYHLRWEAILAERRKHSRSKSLGLMLGEAGDYWRSIIVTRKKTPDAR